MKLLVTLLFGAFIFGCASREPVCVLPGPDPLRPGTINHVVFFKLADPGDAEELIADCDAYLRHIPGVSGYYAGRHYDMGRASIDSDYDVGAFVAFDSREDYQAYLGHPDHVALVEKWQPRWTWIRIYDIEDP